jgi:hypothetical protein
LKPAKSRKKPLKTPKTQESVPAQPAKALAEVEDGGFGASAVGAAPAVAQQAGSVAPEIKRQRAGIRARLWLYTPVLLALLVMLPRLAAPEFGLLDDGVTLLNSRELAGNPVRSLSMSAQHGRFMPGYWLSYLVIFLIGGENPAVFSLANALVFSLITMLLIRLVRLRGGTPLQAWSTGTLFVLSGSAVEVFYTSSKSEGLQALWLVAGILAAIVLPGGSRVRSLFAVGFTALLFFIATATKETGIVIAPIALAWFLNVRLIGRPPQDRMDSAARWRILTAAAIGVAVALILRKAVIVTAVGNYASQYRLDLSRLGESVVAWLPVLTRDCLYLLPLLFVFVWALLRGKPPHTLLLADALVWMLGWVAVFLPWHSTGHYYLLPFAVGAALAGGVLFGAVVEILRSGNRPERILAAGLLVLSLLLVQFHIPNNWTTARIQVALDMSNATLVRFLTSLPRKATVFVNIAEHLEYFYEMKVFVGLAGRSDLSIQPFTGIIPPSAGEFYIATPVMENQPFHGVRCSLSEVYAKDVNRGMVVIPSERLQQVHDFHQSVHLVDIGLDRLAMSLFGLWPAEGWPAFEGRTFRYGWNVYRIIGSPAPARPGSFSDGVWSLRSPGGKTVQRAFGRTGDLPVTGDWNGDGYTDQGVFRPSEQTWYLNLDEDSEPEYRIRLTGMRADDLPVSGDWDGNGSSTPGFYRPADGSWHLRNSLTSGGEDWPAFLFGGPGRAPLIGDWDGDGRDSPGVYDSRSGNVYLTNRVKAGLADAHFAIAPQSVPVAADWAGWGADSLAVVERGRWHLKLINSNSGMSNAVPPFEIDSGGRSPVAGNWR